MADGNNPDPFRAPTNEEIEERLKHVRRQLEGLDLELPGQTSDDEIDARLKRMDEKITESTRTAFPEDPDFEEKLHKVTRDSQELTDRRSQAKREETRRMSSDVSSQQGLGMGLTYAWTLIGIPLLGAGLGWLLTRMFGSPLFIGLGAVIGMALALYFVVNLSNRPGQG